MSVSSTPTPAKSIYPPSPAACSLQAHRKSAVLRSSTHCAPLPRSRTQAYSDGHNVAARGRPHHDRRTRRHVAALRSNATLRQAAHSHFRTPTRIPSCPKVTSAVVRIDVFPQPALPIDSIDAFFTLVRAGFSAPRKQIHNCLQQGLSIPRIDAEALLSDADIDARRRPQTLSLADWGNLYAAWRLRYPDTHAVPEGVRQN